MSYHCCCCLGLKHQPSSLSLLFAEALPSHAIQIDLTVLDLVGQRGCSRAMEQAAKGLAQQVVEDVHSKLHTGQLCNASTVGDRVVLLPRDSKLALTSSRVSVSVCVWVGVMYVCCVCMCVCVCVCVSFLFQNYKDFEAK